MHAKNFAKLYFKLSKEMKAYMEKQLAPHLTEGQLIVLEYLFENEPEAVKPSDLVDYLETSPAAITTLLDRMERGGLIKRVRDASDRRIVWLQVTAKGREEGERGMAVREQFLSARFNRLSQHNQQLLMHMLHKVFND